MTVVKTILRLNPSGLFVFRVLADDIVLLSQTFDSQKKVEDVVEHTLKSMELAFDSWKDKFKGRELTVAMKSPEEEPY